MKIIELKIKTPQGECIRKLSFEENGASFIYADIQEPKNDGATINSLGKTLLLKFIDYIFGAKEDSKIIKKEIHNYKLEAIVLIDNKRSNITRILGNSNEIYIDGTKYKLDDYKKYFGIKRNLYSKQLILEKKSMEISYNKYPNKNDVISCLELLGLLDLLKETDDIYELQDRITNLKKSKKELISFYDNIDIKHIDKEVYFINKNVISMTKELGKIEKKIKNIEISNIQKNIVKEYADKSKKLKKIKWIYEKNRLECERLIEFIENSNKIDVSSKHLLTIFKKAQQEVPEMVQKSIQEVEIFHKKVYEERKEFLSQRKDEIQLEMILLKNNSELLSAEINKIGKIISMNQVYQESIELYKKYNTDLQELIYKQGKLSQISQLQNCIEIETEKLGTSFDKANKTRVKYDDLVQKYRDFIFDITKKLYDKVVNSYFDIKVRKNHLKTRPVVFEFTLSGDTGEGVSEVKKNLMDYLIFRYNTYSEIMIQDSSCYNGSDPRQVVGLLTQLKKIAEESNKQVIVAINKYQLYGYENAISMVAENSVITLAEKDTLLKIQF